MHRLSKAHHFLLKNTSPQNTSHTYISNTAKPERNVATNLFFDKEQMLDPQSIIRLIFSRYQNNQDIQSAMHSFNCIIHHSIAEISIAISFGCNYQKRKLSSELFAKGINIERVENVTATLIIPKISFLQSTSLEQYKQEILQTYEMATKHRLTSSKGKIRWNYAL